MTNKKRLTRCVASILVPSVCAFAALPSDAATISLTGGFTNFYTPFAYGTVSNLPDTVLNYVNGQQLCPANGCAVDGEAYVDFATPVTSVSWWMQVDGYNWTKNVVAFTPATNQVVNGFGPSNKFLFGTLTFTNGIWSDPNVRLSFNLTANSPDPMFNNYDFEVSDVIVEQSTVNSPTNTPDQNADYIYLAGNPQLGSLRAYELSDSPNGSNTVTVDVYGYLGSLHFLEFANPRGGGFLDAGIALQPVPEPGTLELMLAGVAGLMMLHRGTRSKAVRA